MLTMKKIATKMSTPTVKMRMIWTPAEGLVIEHGDDDDDDDDNGDDDDSYNDDSDGYEVYEIEW